MLNQLFIGFVAILAGLIVLIMGAVIDHAPAIPTLILVGLVFVLGFIFGVSDE